jgi:hypothetical protein
MSSAPAEKASEAVLFLCCHQANLRLARGRIPGRPHLHFLLFLPPYYYYSAPFGACLLFRHNSPAGPARASRSASNCAHLRSARCFFAIPFPSSRSSWIGSMDAKRGTGPRKLPVPNIAISCFSSSLASFVCASSQLYVRPGQHSRCNTVPVLRIGPLSALI